MKNLKFSRLFAAFAFVAILALAGCKQPDEEKSVVVEGTWVNDSGEKYVITKDSVKSYWGEAVLYEMSIDEIEEVTDNSGILYGILTTGSSYTPKDTYYAFAYKEVNDNAAKLSGAWTSSATIDEEKTAYANLEAFASFSDLVKAEEE